MIVSSQNAKLKLVRSLQGRPKGRQKSGAFLAEGVRLVADALDADWPFRFLLYSDAVNEHGRKLIERLESKGGSVEEVERSLLQAISDTETSQGLAAVLELEMLPLPKQPAFVLIPDQIRDPGNLGALLRSAAAAGVQAVLAPPETTDPFAPKVVRSGMGAHFRLPVHSLSWEQIRAYCRRTRLYLADMEGQSCWECDLRLPLGLIVGGEAAGASQPARDLADQAICIPMQGQTESLNASVAGAILMFEVVRQQQ
ncbi:MAG: RNA methyltransferase [Anaerolineales bacterium]|nr:RNA methyltransferase [Anaerolineales bacterium]